MSHAELTRVLILFCLVLSDYVNRGIGMEGGPVPRVRFCSRPEVTVIELGSVP
ncbi:MAG TPA: hypothetical protein VNE39_03890 [Planctomycetota bacterium]|nr:hypothetical protein [Planctomycetota bacterium]